MHCPLLSFPLGIKEKGGGKGEKERGFVKMWLIFQILDSILTLGSKKLGGGVIGFPL